MAESKVKKTRTAKPFYALVTVTAEDGSTMELDPKNVSVTLEKNADSIIALLQGGDSAGATLVRATMPAAG